MKILNELDEKSNEKIEKIAKRRFNTHKKLGGYLNLNDIISLLIINYESGFKCSYCKCDLKFEDNYPYKNVPSIDHFIPISMGGKNIRNNIIICCAKCNIIKGTLSGDTYMELLKRIGINSAFHKKFIYESYKGKFANKIARVNEEKEKRIIKNEDLTDEIIVRLDRVNKEFFGSGLTPEEFMELYNLRFNINKDEKIENE